MDRGPLRTAGTTATSEDRGIVEKLVYDDLPYTWLSSLDVSNKTGIDRARAGKLLYGIYRYGDGKRGIVEHHPDLNIAKYRGIPNNETCPACGQVQVKNSLH